LQSSLLPLDPFVFCEYERNLSSIFTNTFVCVLSSPLYPPFSQTPMLLNPFFSLPPPPPTPPPTTTVQHISLPRDVFLFFRATFSPSPRTLWEEFRFALPFDGFRHISIFFLLFPMNVSNLYLCSDPLSFQLLSFLTDLFSFLLFFFFFFFLFFFCLCCGWFSFFYVPSLCLIFLGFLVASPPRDVPNGKRPVEYLKLATKLSKTLVESRVL